MKAKGLAGLAQTGALVLLSVLLAASALQAPVAQAATIEITPISAIAEPLLDSYVTIKGTVLEAGNFSKGFRFVVADDTGRIDVTYFESVFDTLSKPELVRVGAVAQITGRVDEYEGKFSIIPNRGKETLVFSNTVRTVDHRELGGLNNGDHGAIILVEGEVHSVEKFDNGVDVLIFDATGTQKVRLYNVVAARIKKDVLVTGSKVSVTGKVKATRKFGLRIDVALPSDVVVITSAGLKQQVVPTATVKVAGKP